MALDAVQEGFARALRGRASYRGDGTLDAWVARCVLTEVAVSSKLPAGANGLRERLLHRLLPEFTIASNSRGRPLELLQVLAVHLFELLLVHLLIRRLDVAIFFGPPFRRQRSPTRRSRLLDAPKLGHRHESTATARASALKLDGNRLRDL